MSVLLSTSAFLSRFAQALVYVNGTLQFLTFSTRLFSRFGVLHPGGRFADHLDRRLDFTELEVLMLLNFVLNSNTLSHGTLYLRMFPLEQV